MDFYVPNALYDSTLFKVLFKNGHGFYILKVYFKKTLTDFVGDCTKTLFIPIFGVRSVV